MITTHSIKPRTQISFKSLQFRPSCWRISENNRYFIQSEIAKSVDKLDKSGVDVIIENQPPIGYCYDSSCYDVFLKNKDNDEMKNIAKLCFCTRADFLDSLKKLKEKLEGSV